MRLWNAEIVLSGAIEEMEARVDVDGENIYWGVGGEMGMREIHAADRGGRMRDVGGGLYHVFLLQAHTCSV